mmetsp:Transcript_2178/g.7340  ORF Transcript_2178/g.7340 Transcript_2178/m.7340 type:complete len:210 (+) Transcript_2178:1150-1779(+)
MDRANDRGLRSLFTVRDGRVGGKEMAHRSVGRSLPPSLLGHHHLDELLVVDLAVAVDVGFAEHLVDFFVGELFAEVGHDVAELGGGDEAVAVLVEDLEGFEDFLLGVGVLHFPGHHRQELGEVDRAVAVGVDFVDHVGQLGFRRVLPEGTHHGAELLGGDGAVAVLVEEGEGLLELGDLLFGQLIGLRRRGGVETAGERTNERVIPRDR